MSTTSDPILEFYDINCNKSMTDMQGGKCGDKLVKTVL